MQTARSESVRLAIIEDDAATRKMLVEALGSEPGYHIIAEFGDGQTAISALQQIDPDLLLVDLGLPDISGLKVIEKAMQVNRNCNILVLTSLGDEDTIIAALEAGARGYLLKGCTEEELRRDLRALREGGSPLSPAVARTLLDRLSGRKHDSEFSGKQDLLTKREIRILEMIAHGHSYMEVAKLCEISAGTVHSHLKHIYRKLEAHSKTEAIHKARIRRIIK